jgi:hypothetical protein
MDGHAWLALTDDQGTADTADDSTRLIKTALAVSGTGFAGTGKDYVLGSSTVRDTTVDATAQAGATLSGNMTGAGAETFSLAYQSRYDTAATLADFANTWRSTAGNGAVTLNWSVTQTGSVTGTSTTGCSYSGQISLRAEAKAVADANLTETCAGAAIVYAGAATYNPNTARATLALTSADGASGLLLSWAR